MERGDRSNTELELRRAMPADYDGFCRLFPELLVDDPTPTPETWATLLAPGSWLAVRGADLLGYCYFQEYASCGYVRHIVVAPTARRQGVGRALMQKTAQTLREHGKREWRLNVKPQNQAALALYARMGLRKRYSTRALRFPWAVLTQLPAGNALVRELTPERDAALSALFDLPDGQLSAARVPGRVLLEAVGAAGGEPIGLSSFDPKFPGAFPFRLLSLDALRPLLTTMRTHVPGDEHVGLVIEDDERLAALLEGVGATLRHEISHLVGTL